MLWVLILAKNTYLLVAWLHRSLIFTLFELCFVVFFNYRVPQLFRINSQFLLIVQADQELFFFIFFVLHFLQNVLMGQISNFLMDVVRRIDQLLQLMASLLFLWAG
jgi:hypothetical protein